MRHPAIEQTERRIHNAKMRRQWWQGAFVLGAIALFAGMLGTVLTITNVEESPNTGILNFFITNGIVVGLCCAGIPFLTVLVVMIWRNSVEITNETRHLEMIRANLHRSNQATFR